MGESLILEYLPGAVFTSMSIGVAQTLCKNLLVVSLSVYICLCHKLIYLPV